MDHELVKIGQPYMHTQYTDFRTDSSSQHALPKMQSCTDYCCYVSLFSCMYQICKDKFNSVDTLNANKTVKFCISGTKLPLCISQLYCPYDIEVWTRLPQRY